MAVPATPARAAQRLEPSLSPVLFNAKTLDPRGASRYHVLQTQGTERYWPALCPMLCPRTDVPYQGKLEAEYEMAAAEVRRPGLSGGIMLCVGRTVSAYAHTKIKRVRQHSAKSNQRFSTLHTKCTSRMHDCV
eukprot:3548931-Rhodomonas_salina.2